ncbi:MAG: hypothetical protein R6V83_03625 [Candidatus Thorarchaeota archaeon]
MAKRRNRLWRLFRLNFEGSYRFPSLASIVSIMLFVLSYTVLSQYMWNVGVYLAPGAEWWSSTGAIERAEQIARERIAMAYFHTFQSSLFVLILLVPLLIAFTLAQGFSNGELRTLLSYPTTRPRVLLTKTGTAILVTAITANVSSILALFFFFPVLPHIPLILLLMLTQWSFAFLLGSACTLVAVVSKSAPATLVTGIGGWMAGLTLATNPASSQLIQGIFYPVQSIIVYMLGDIAVFRGLEVSFLDVFVPMTASFILGIVLLVIGLIAFMWREI